MARKFRKGGYRKKGFKAKRWNKKRKQVNVNKALQPIPQRYICNMKYSETFALSQLSPGYTYNLNSIFDPNRTGVGHQPYSHDTMQTLYNRYRVISCSYTITCYNASNAIRMVAIPSNEALAAGSVSEVCENPRAKWILQTPQSPMKKLHGRCYIPSLVGRSKAQYMADDRYQATFGSSPGELAILNIYHANLADVGVDNTLATITLNYKVELFDVKNLAQS